MHIVLELNTKHWKPIILILNADATIYKMKYEECEKILIIIINNGNFRADEKKNNISKCFKTHRFRLAYHLPPFFPSADIFSRTQAVNKNNKIKDNAENVGAVYLMNIRGKRYGKGASEIPVAFQCCPDLSFQGILFEYVQAVLCCQSGQVYQVAPIEMGGDSCSRECVHVSQSVNDVWLLVLYLGTLLFHHPKTYITNYC